MTDALLIDIATKVEPAIEVVFVDTGYHFPETLETVEWLRRRYGLNLRIMTVPHYPVPLGSPTRPTAAPRPRSLSWSGH